MFPHNITFQTYTEVDDGMGGKIKTWADAFSTAAHVQPVNSSEFVVNRPVITRKLPPFVSNTLVFWVNNQKGICELLWIVTRKSNGKLKIDFNTEGVAYLQAKGAMPS